MTAAAAAQQQQQQQHAWTEVNGRRCSGLLPPVRRFGS